MRLLTRKIYRAYPELDKFDDDVCKMHVKRARRLKSTWKLWGLQLISVPITLLMWSFASGMAEIIFFFGQTEHQDRLAQLVQNPTLLIFTLIQWSGYVFVPAIICLLIRDDWLHHCIRKQIAEAQCGACGYSLLGLAITEHQGQASVHCPECGDRVLLKDMGLTEADIDPTLVQESA